MVRKNRTDNAVMTFPGSVIGAKSSIYSVTAGSDPVAVETFEDIHYAHFAFSGECEVTVSVKPSIGHRNLKFIREFSISPRRYGIRADAELNRLTFKLSQPRKLVIQVNEYERLFLFADAAETDAPKPGDAGVITAADFVTDLAGKTLQTEAIRRAVEATPRGGTLYFPPGVYLTGTVSLRSYMTLYLAGGAVLKGSSHEEDYPSDELSSHWANRQFINVARVQNVLITGFGTLDAGGSYLRARQFGPHLMTVTDSRSVTVENIFVRDPAAWTCHPINSDYVTFRNVKMLNNRDVLNTDGFDITSSRHVVVEDCFAYTSDDAVVIKSYGDRTCEDVLVRGNVLLPKKSALKVGTENEADVTDVTFIDNEVVECDRGMSLYSEDGGTIRDVRYINNRFERCYPDARRRLLDFYIWNRKGGGNIENVLIKDCVADEKWPRPSTIIGLDDKNAVRGVHFENFVLEGRLCRDLAQADITVEVYPFEDIRLPNVHDITFVPGCDTRWNPSLLVGCAGSGGSTGCPSIEAAPAAATVDLEEARVCWDAPCGLVERDGGLAPARFAAEVFDMMRRKSPGSITRMECPANCILRMNTDASKVALGVRFIDMPRDYCEFVARSGSRRIGFWRELALKPGDYRIELPLDGAGTMREVEILLPQNVDFVFTYMSVAGTLGEAPAPRRPVWLAIGDSNTQGMNAVSPFTYVENLSSALSIGAWNLGIGGACMDKTPFEWAFARAQWKVVSIALGSNDWIGGRPLDEFRLGCKAVIDAASKGATCAKLVLITPVTAVGEDARPIALEKYREAIRETATGKRCIVVEGGALADHAKGHFTLDGLHLNDDGYRACAEALRPFIEPLI